MTRCSGPSLWNRRILKYLGKNASQHNDEYDMVYIHSGSASKNNHCIRLKKGRIQFGHSLDKDRFSFLPMRYDSNDLGYWFPTRFFQGRMFFFRNFLVHMPICLIRSLRERLENNKKLKLFLSSI